MSDSLNGLLVDCPYCGHSTPWSEDRAGEVETCQSCGDLVKVATRSALEPARDAQVQKKRTMVFYAKAFGLIGICLIGLSITLRISYQSRLAKSDGSIVCECGRSTNTWSGDQFSGEPMPICRQCQKHRPWHVRKPSKTLSLLGGFSSLLIALCFWYPYRGT